MLPGVSPTRRKPRADGKRKVPELSRAGVCARVAPSPIPERPRYFFLRIIIINVCRSLCRGLCRGLCRVLCR